MLFRKCAAAFAAVMVVLGVNASCSSGDSADESSASSEVTTTSRPNSSQATSDPIDWGPAPTPSLAEVRVEIADFDRLRVHTFVAPVEYTSTATHVLETEAHLLVVDGHTARTFATAFRQYVDALNKPVERVILSHGHPDHWFGLAMAFSDQPIWADATTWKRITEKGEGDLGRLGNLLPAAELPSGVLEVGEVVEPGSITVDGVEFRFDVHAAAEAPSQVTISVPEAKVFVGQDLVYSDGHLFVGNGTFEDWIGRLDTIAAEVDSNWLVLAGHGLPTTSAVFASEKEYLLAAKQAKMDSTSAAEFVEAMAAKYPDLPDRLVLQLAANQLYGEGGFAPATSAP